MYDHMLNQTVTIANVGGSNDYGETSFGTPSDVKARVELVNKSKMSPSGEAIVIAAEVFVRPADVVDAGSKITFDGVNYKVSGKEQIPDGTGKTRLVVLECTEWR